MSPYPIKVLPGPGRDPNNLNYWNGPNQNQNFGSSSNSNRHRICLKTDYPYESIQNAGSDKNTSERRFDQYEYKKVMKDLQDQDGKRKVEIKVSGYTYRIDNPDRLDHRELQDELAEKIYDSIRQSDTDIYDIPENLSLPADDIKNIKDHVFFNKHYLDRYAEPAEPIPYERFDANLQQALAWKRLTVRSHTEDAIIWLKHERVERKYELRLKLGYSEAHRLAQSRFDGSPWGN
jgi:hypothetical protein